MKLNKIVSVFAAVSMIATSIVSVSAAGAIKTEYISDYEYTAVTNLPSSSEVLARSPKLSYTTTKLEGTDIKTATDNAFYLKNKNNDVYAVTYTYSNIGELVSGYNADIARSALGIYSVSLRLSGAKDDVLAVFSAKNGSEGAATKFGLDSATGIYTATWTLSVEDPYPLVQEDMNANYVADPTISQTFVVALTPGASVTWAADAVGGAVQYTIVEDTVSNNYPVQEFEKTAITIPKPQEPEKDIVITEVEDKENVITLGKAWNVDFKYDTAKAYTATFTDLDEADEAKKTLVRELDFSGVAEWENGSRYSFVTLLRTTKANVELAIN